MNTAWAIAWIVWLAATGASFGLMEWLSGRETPVGQPAPVAGHRPAQAVAADHDPVVRGRGGGVRGLVHPAHHWLTRNPKTDEKVSVFERTPGGTQQVWHVTEPGFYHVVGQRQPARIKDAVLRAQVERFQRWVHHDVLPSIRLTGSYETQVRKRNEFGVDVTPPDTYTYDEVCGLLRQFFGVNLTVNELTRNLRAGGVLKQNGAPTKKHAHLFWFTGHAWNIHKHVVPQVAFKVYDTGRELQDFRFLQARLELEGVGQSFDATSARRLAA